MTLTPKQYLDELAKLADEFEQVLRAAELTAPVPQCGDWTLRDLGAHLGHTHRWAATIVRTGELSKERHAPNGAPIADWYAESAGELLDELRAADPDAPCWGFGVSKIKAFWFRRQAQETFVHLHDARNAAGTVSTLDPVWASDGIDEVLAVFLPNIKRWYQPPKLAAPLVLRASDTGDTWLLRPATEEGESPTTERGAAPDGATTVTAAAEDLLLMLWKRRSTAEVRPEIVGEPGVASDFLLAPLTP